MRALIEAGVAGINLEDGVQHRSLRDVDDAARRIAAARTAAQAAGVPIVINARVDVWIVGRDANPTARLADAVHRARAYLAAGADCVYPLGLTDRDTIAALVAAIDAPVNVGAFPACRTWRSSPASVLPASAPRRVWPCSRSRPRARRRAHCAAAAAGTCSTHRSVTSTCNACSRSLERRSGRVDLQRYAEEYPLENRGAQGGT